MEATTKVAMPKLQFTDIALDVSWARLSRAYFGKPASWIYNKMNGIDGNGGTAEFSEAEKATLKAALYDLASRIKTAADEFE